MEPISLTAAVLGVTKSLTIVTDAVRWIISIKSVPLEMIDLQNELQTVQGYIVLLESIMESFHECDRHSQLTAALDHVKGIVTSLEADLEDIHQVLSTLSSSRRDSLPKWLRVKWMLSRKTVIRHRDRVRQRRVELAQGISLLQTAESHRNTILLLNIQDVARISLPSNGCSRFTPIPHGPHHTRSDDVPIADEGMVSAECQPSSGLVGVIAGIDRIDTQTCYCNCHSSREFQSGDLFAQFLGRILVNYSSIPLWGSPSCGTATPCHCRASELEFSSIRLHYIFPEWLFLRAIYMTVSWEAIHGTGAAIHLRIARVIPYTHKAWIAMEQNAIHDLQSMLDSREILPTDVDRKGNPLFYYSRVRKIDSYTQGERFLLPLRGDVYAGHSCQRSPWVRCGLAPRQITPYTSWSNFKQQLQIYRAILTAQSGVNLEDHVGRVENLKTTILHDLIIHYHQNGSTEPPDSNNLGPILRSTLSSSPSAIAAINVHDSLGFTPLHWVVYLDDVDAVSVLLDYGADICAEDLAGNTPISFAFFHSNLACLVVMMNHMNQRWNIEAIHPHTGVETCKAAASELLQPALEKPQIVRDLLTRWDPGLGLGTGSPEASQAAAICRCTKNWTVLHFRAHGGRRREAEMQTEDSSESAQKYKEETLPDVPVSEPAQADRNPASKATQLLLAFRSSSGPATVREMLDRGTQAELEDTNGLTLVHFIVGSPKLGKAMEILVEEVEQTARQAEAVETWRQRRKSWLAGMNPTWTGRAVSGSAREGRYKIICEEPEDTTRRLLGFPCGDDDNGCWIGLTQRIMLFCLGA